MFSRFFMSVGVLLCASPLVFTPALASDIDVDFSGSYRLRYETLHNPIFPTDASTRSRSNDRISSRLLLKGQANWEHWNAIVEIQDSRTFLSDNDPTLTSSQVNTLEPLQFFLRYSDINEYVKAVTVGRMTLDHGSRRLVARGIYRNTQNAFDGITVDTEYHRWAIRGFYLLPVSRLPSATDLVEDNERAFDKSFSERKFFGLYATSPDKAWNLQSYWFRESDGPDLATRNRDLYTLSAEYTTTFAGDWQANAELIGQTGTARQTTAADDVTDLDVRAWMAHGHIGRNVTDSTFVRAEIDFASGDDNSSDDTIHTPDSLFGVRRFDFGPTDVYQGFRRSNIIAPGLRSVTTFDRHEIMVGYKAAWYDKVADGADDFMGQQLELRWRYQALPDLRLEFGGAYLHKGDGLETGDYSDDTQFAYTAFLYSF